MLAGPLYMLQIHDRVLASRSVPTLVALTTFLVGALAFQGRAPPPRERSWLGGRARQLTTSPFPASAADSARLYRMLWRELLDQSWRCVRVKTMMEKAPK